MSSMSTNNNANYSNAIMYFISEMEGSALLNIINSNELLPTMIVQNMSFLIQRFITCRPYEQTLWELYSPNTMEQFKTNLKIQQFVKSNNFEYMVELSNNNINERKVLFGMLYYNANYFQYCSINNEKRLENIISIINDLSNDNIKYLIQVISICPLIGDVEEFECDIKFICENNQQIEFLNYLREMLNLDNIYIRPVDIIYSFNYSQDKLELFKEYCQAGIWSEHAKDFVEENIIMTDQRKEIYFALVGDVNSLTLHTCVENNIMRNLTINPITLEEQEYLNYELMCTRRECGIPRN
jgi:hypothetical protein